MSPKSIFAMVALGSGVGYLMFNYEKFQGCGTDHQDFELAKGSSRPVACSAAQFTYVDDNDSAPQLEISCDGSDHQFSMYSALLAQPVCGLTVALLDRWKGGPVETWNVHISLTWEKR